MKRSNKFSGRKLVFSDLTKPKGVGADVIVREEPVIAGTGDIPSVEEVNKAAPPPPSPFEQLAQKAREASAAQPPDPRLAQFRKDEESATRRAVPLPAEPVDIIELPNNEVVHLTSLADQIKAQKTTKLPSTPIDPIKDVKLKIPELPTRAPKAVKKPAVPTKRKRCAVDDVQITVNVSDLATLISRASDIASGRYDPVDAYRLMTALDVMIKTASLRKTSKVDPIIAYRRGTEQVNIALSEVLVDIQDQMTAIVETAREGVRDIL